jgi:hypothetical protein
LSISVHSDPSFRKSATTAPSSPSQNFQKFGFSEYFDHPPTSGRPWPPGIQRHNWPPTHTTSPPVTPSTWNQAALPTSLFYFLGMLFASLNTTYAPKWTKYTRARAVQNGPSENGTDHQFDGLGPKILHGKLIA